MSESCVESRTVTRAIVNARVLTPEGWIDNAAVVWRGGMFEEVRHRGGLVAGAEVIDAAGALLLPGIVDIHGDGFEHHITPRPGVDLDLVMGLHSNDSALISAGITTFFYSITDGFEPGLRGRDTVRATLQGLEESRARMWVDSRVHIRHEVAASKGIGELLDWLRKGRVHHLSINDHLPHLDHKNKCDRYLKALTRRVPMAETEQQAFLERLQADRLVGQTQVGPLAELARALKIPLASHDDATPEDMEQSCALGISIAEFPATLDLAKAYRAQGIHVVMGAPNLVRGASHTGSVSVREALAEGAVDCLCSDYHYPSLYRAAFQIVELGLMSLAEAWSLVSFAPAHAVGLSHRKGCIVAGADADFLLVKTPDGLVSGLSAVIVGGRTALQRF